MCEDVVCRKANTESKRSRRPCVATWNAHAPGKQRCLRLKSKIFFSFEKTKCFRWLTWGKLLYTVTGIWIQLMFVLPLKSTTRPCLILRSILHAGQIWPFPLFVFLFTNLYHSNFHPNNSCWPPLWNQKLPLVLSHSLSFSSSCKQCFFFQDHCNIQKILHCHWTEQLYIYVCTMKMNSHCLYLHGTNIQNAYIRYKKKKNIYILVCDR